MSRPPRVRLDADDRRDLILAAAQRLFAERPYSAVSTTQLAEAAGTSRTNLHYYFRTKRELYLATMERFGRLPALPAGPERVVTGAAEVERLFARWLDVLEANPETIMTILGAGGPGPDVEVQAVFRDGARAWEDRLLAVLEIADRPANRALVRSFQGMVGVAVVEWLRHGSLTKDQVRRLLTRSVGLIAEDVAERY